MAETRPPTVIHHPTQHPTPAPADRPSPAVKRAQVVATRSAASSPAAQAAVYRPWDTLLRQADARLKTELTAALRELEQGTAVAGTLLDTAYSMAAEAAQALENAAWAAWHKYMAAADDTRNTIIGRAVTAYDEQIKAMHTRYNKSISDAETTYKTLADDASRAQTAAKSIVS